jgi:hypothetical protein
VFSSLLQLPSIAFCLYHDVLNGAQIVGRRILINVSWVRKARSNFVFHPGLATESCWQCCHSQSYRSVCIASIDYCCLHNLHLASRNVLSRWWYVLRLLLTDDSVTDTSIKQSQSWPLLSSLLRLWSPSNRAGLLK